MSPRDAVSLAPPPDDPAALRDFPRQPVRPRQTLWRVVKKRRGPWWFGSSGDSRFDLPEPEGTCYLAADELAALLEVIGSNRGAISTRFLEERGLRRLHLPREQSFADLTSRRAAAFGVTLEIGTVVPYETPQLWALRLRESGADGLLYFVRHDPAAGRGLALFGTHGERRSWRRGRELAIDRQLVERLETECGIRVIEVPRLDQLRLAESPTTA